MADKPTYEELEQRIKALESQRSGHLELDLAALFQGFEDSFPIGITDLKGVILYVNNALVEMWGYSSPEEIIGRQLNDFWEGPGIYRTMEDLAAKGWSMGEDIGKRKDDSFFPVEYKAIMCKNIDGKPLYMLGQFFDISDRKLAEERLEKAHIELENHVDKKTAELRETTEQLNALMNATADTILLIDLKGYVVAANAVAARRLGITQDQLFGTFVCDLLSPELAKSRKAIGNRVVKTGKPHRLKDDRKGFIFDSTLYPVLDKGGKVMQVAIYGKDITELKRSERALKKSEGDLQIKTKSLEEMNTALRILLNSKGEDQKEFEEKILANLKHLVMPYLGKMRKHLTDEKLKAYLQILETNLSNIISPFSQRLSSKYMYLTTTEIEVANLVKEGKNSKDIAEMLGTSHKTIQNHRVNIRKKLGITKKPVNLRTYLSSLQ